MNIFSDIVKEFKLQPFQIDDFANKAFDEIQISKQQFSLRFDEDGIYIDNFEETNDEENGGWTKEEVENSLSDDFFKKIRTFCCK